MRYKSKKDPTVIASYDFQNPKTKTIRMIYLTGDKAGNSFEISSSTLERWWSKVEADDKEAEAEILNTPYRPNVTPHYIPKPESVIKYEERKRKARMNTEFPEFKDMVNDLGSAVGKVNTGYIYIKNTKTTVWRQANAIVLYADEQVWEKFVAKGFKSESNPDKARPFTIKVKTADEYETFKSIILDNFK